MVFERLKAIRINGAGDFVVHRGAHRARAACFCLRFWVGAPRTRSRFLDDRAQYRHFDLPLAARKGDAPQREGMYHGGYVGKIRQGDVLHQVNADFVKPIGQFLGVGAMPVGAEARARAKGDDVEVEGVRGVEDLFADELDLWMEEFHVVCVVFRMSCVGFRVSWGFMGQR